MKVLSSRFGELNVNQEDILYLSEGMLGFENLKKFVIVDPSDKTLILWLQSTEDKNVAFPVLEPQILFPTYHPKLMPADRSSIKLGDSDSFLCYNVLTIPKDIKEISINLKAPIIINPTGNTARQIVLQDNKLEVKKNIFKELRLAIAQSSVSDDSKRTRIIAPQGNNERSSSINPSSADQSKLDQPKLEQANLDQSN